VLRHFSDQALASVGPPRIRAAPQRGCGLQVLGVKFPGPALAAALPTPPTHVEQPAAIHPGNMRAVTDLADEILRAQKRATQRRFGVLYQSRL